MLTVGQKLYYVPSDGRWEKPQWITITKVGRKWAETNHIYLRISIDTLRADGGKYMSPGRCYLSEDEHKAEVELYKEWRDFELRIRNTYNCPDGVDIDDIRRARALLFPNAPSVNDGKEENP